MGTITNGLAGFDSGVFRFENVMISALPYTDMYVNIDIKGLSSDGRQVKLE